MRFGYAINVSCKADVFFFSIWSTFSADRLEEHLTQIISLVCFSLFLSSFTQLYISFRLLGLTLQPSNHVFVSWWAHLNVRVMNDENLSVSSGSAMNVVYGEDEMKRFLEEATQVSQVRSAHLTIWPGCSINNLMWSVLVLPHESCKSSVMNYVTCSLFTHYHKWMMFLKLHFILSIHTL